ncbi:response regulator transcription factor [Rhizobium sp. Root708]|uniref:response regulator transcription factor n=1 Tax=Rhizobium sp. Root708 TaxID=1736592 RepID=UPI000B12F77F
MIRILDRAPELPGSDVCSSTPVVYIVDDDVSVRESLEGLVCSGGWRAEAYACAESFLSSVRPEVRSCLILDLNLPDLSGLQVQSRVREEHQDTPIIFITGDADVPCAVQAMKAGACEYLLKPLAPDELLDAIGRCIMLSSAELDRRSQYDMMLDRYHSLTLRERQVMSLVAGGLMNKVVAY